MTDKLSMTRFDFDLSPYLNDVIPFIDDGIILADSNGKVLFHNYAVNELLGLDPVFMLHKLNDVGKFNLQRILLKAAIDAGNVDAAGKPNNEFITFDQQFKHHDGQRLVEITSGLIHEPDRHDKVRLIIMKDRTDTRRIESVMNPSAEDFSTQDPRMLETIQRLEQIAPMNAFVLLQGESGTGKTRLARRIHQMSLRAKEPFVEVNCAAIPESLLESELFGHIKGAFTGASSDRPGRFQTAHKGTLFLDEIGEIPLHLQAKLLRAIQDQEFEMVGSDKPIKVNVRIVAASNRNLRDMVDQNHFRADLFYRLAVIPLTIPSLRERPGDISMLIKILQKRLVDRGYSADITFSHAAIKCLMDYPWPGNVRELENAVEHGMICAIDNIVTESSLPQDIREFRSKPNPSINDDKAESQELQEIKAVLSECHGNKAEAARVLGVNRTTLWRWIHKYGL